NELDDGTAQAALVRQGDGRDVQGAVFRLHRAVAESADQVFDPRFLHAFDQAEKNLLPAAPREIGQQVHDAESGNVYDPLPLETAPAGSGRKTSSCGTRKQRRKAGSGIAQPGLPVRLVI